MLSFNRISGNQLRRMATTAAQIKPKDHYYLVIVGGGAGGLSIASKFAEVLTVLDKGKVAVIEPTDVLSLNLNFYMKLMTELSFKCQTHYYQPMWTLVGAGIKDLSESARPMASVMPKKVHWIKDKCVAFEPDKNRIRLSGANGVINYEHLLVAVGMNIDWHKIKGIPEAFETPGVCSNYSTKTVVKTFPAIKDTKEGNAIFTFPNGPIKCAGAPQKIMYLSDAYWREVCLDFDLTQCLTHFSIDSLFLSYFYVNNRIFLHLFTIYKRFHRFRQKRKYKY